ncbi:hypothetical protein Forpe1208_v010955 [Fusarium oxysporum f. sp. rapae]|uniref:Uncharacterized protein n=1 Tax=Fusarium oxysporum f. sp. rapae TaxID=485398 RepID=A0A8J5NPZ0_FUSOX|nr:hypothetical protein Forpe1208_v010955 [Fusarium oxysporum f. sp. rapae]
MHARGIINAQLRPHLLYKKLRLHTPECEVFRTSDVYNLEQRPIIGHFQYDEHVKQRERANRPKRHPIPGARNLPAERLYQRRLRDVAPALWFEDPRHPLQTPLRSRKTDRRHGQPRLASDTAPPGPFEPHASFSERVAGQLLAGLKTRAEEEMPRGEKRKRDELDAEGETKSVKAWYGAVQVAAVPLANG